MKLALDRQLLGGSHGLPITDIVESLCGLNAQTPRGPAVGLWTRIGDYDHRRLDELRRSYELVQANLMRATVHLVTRRQFLSWRRALEPTLRRSVAQFCRGIWDVVDENAVVAAGASLLHTARTEGLSRSEIGEAQRLVRRRRQLLVSGGFVDVAT